MKIRRILTAFLAVLMASACMSIVAFAADEAELMAVEPIKLSITSAGNDQRCTKKDGVIDMMGRTVQQLFPMSSTSSVAPAWISNHAERQKLIDSGYAHQVIKFVYYVSGSSGIAPTLATWSYKNNKMTGTGNATALDAPAAAAGKWNTAYYKLPAALTVDPFYGFMFNLYGNDAANKHMNDTIYIGYIGLFDTVENAKAHKSDFEGDLVLSGINVGGTAVAGFSASTKSYTVDLKGADAVPEITVTGTGNSNDLKIEKGAYDSANGTATATVTAGANVYTLNFTGGAKATGLAPVECTWNYNSNDNHGSNKVNVTDEFGRAHISQVPRATSNSNIYPGGTLSGVENHKVLKLVYKTCESKIPTLAVNFNKGTSTVSYDVTPEAGKWNVVYYTIGNTANDTLSTYQVNFSTKKGSELTSSDYYYIGYAAAFGSLLDAKAHKSVFEGELNITSVKVGGQDVTFEGGVASIDANGAATVPEITLTATGNTNDVVITNGKFDKNGNAVSTVKNGDATLYTVNFTGGVQKPVPAVEIPFEWNGYGNGISAVDTITDEFTRTYKQYNPLGQYYENGQDKFSTSAVGPGGNISSHIPEGFALSDYKVVKLVYFSSDDFVPTFTQYTASVTNANRVTASYDKAPEKNKWNVVYYNLKELPVYQLHFTPDNSLNHPDGVYRIAYAAFFPDMEAAKAHKSAFEGDFTITDVRLDGVSVGNVSTYTKDLEGAGTLPKLTVVATGDAEGVKITNGVINAEGKATSTVTKNGSALVTVSFTGGSTEFKIVDILVDGVSLPGFSPEKAEYTVDLGFAAPKPSVTYTYQGIEETVTVDVAATTEDGLTSKYVATLTKGTEVLYTITFNVDTNKPDALLNTLYKLQNDKEITVGYFGGSVTAGTGASNANNLSWRGLTRDWLRTTFPNATITERNAAIGGTGAIFGVFRADQDLIKDKAPDLVFIEMCVNDNYDGIYGTNEMYVYIESIVQNIYDSNPKSDIVFVITGDHGILQKDINGTEEYGIPYKLIGEHYNIPVIYVGRELAKHLVSENGGKYPSSSGDALWKTYFTDGVHLTDKGYAHYAKTLIDWMTPNLPVSYTPSASDYKDKVIPETAYCTLNNKGALMADATMVNPDKFNKSYLGGYKIGSETKFGGHPLMGYNEGDVISLKFNGSALGMWTWSYGETNSNTYKTGTNITYSIDGGAPKTLYVYRSFANNRIYTLASGLSDGEHTIRIYHDDNKAPLHIYNFLIWDLHGRTASVDTVPYFNFDTEDYSVTLDGEEFDFDPDVLTNEIPVQLTSGESYPVLGFDVRDDFYGYAITQATEETGIATLEIDNVGKYTFAFVNGTSMKVGSTTDATYGKDDGTVTLEEAAEYAFQLKTSDEDWTDAVTYDAGTLKVTDLAAGKYNVRYIIEDGVYGLSTSFVVGIVYPYDNVYYVTTGGTGDGKSFGNPADAGSSVGVLVSNAAAFFGNKATTEDCYVILVGEVVHSSNATVINSALYKNLTILGTAGSKFRMQTHISFAAVTAASGYLTFKDIDIVLGNPAATTANYNSEIMIDAKANGITFDNFNIVEFATCSTGETRTDVICLNYWADGGTGAVGLGRPVTVNTAGKTFSVARGTGYNKGDESGDAKFVINGGTVPTVKMGGHVNAEKHTGVFRAEINGGNISTLMLSGDSATSNIGSVIATVNGGTIGAANVASTASDESAVDRVLILNNGMSIATINNKTKVDYILKGGIGGSAAAVTNDSKRLSGFVFTTDKETVVINKGLAGEKVLTVTDGTAELAIADLAAGEYTVTYEDVPKPEGYVEIKTEIALGREVGKVPASGNHLTLVITNMATGELVKKVDLEAADTAVGENGTVSIDIALELGNTEDNTAYKVELKKNGYATVSDTFIGDDLVKYLASYVEGKAETFENGHGDIKGAYDAESGDGKVDIDDFIRVVRGFDSAATAEYSALVDLDEDGAITVKDLAIVKRNFGFDAEGLLN